jgi:hypothetical protein
MWNEFLPIDTATLDRLFQSGDAAAVQGGFNFHSTTSHPGFAAVHLLEPDSASRPNAFSLAHDYATSLRTASRPIRWRMRQIHSRPYFLVPEKELRRDLIGGRINLELRAKGRLNG